MRVFWRQYSFWFFVSNWLITSSVLLVMCRRFSEKQHAFQLLDFRPIGEQSSILICVLVVAVSMVVIRAGSAFLLFMSSYNIEGKSVEWMNEEEYNQQAQQMHRLHMQLLLSLLLTVVVFSLHYLIGLFVVGVYAMVVYALCSWFIGLYCIVLLRRGSKLPKLSTYEYAVKKRLTFYSAMMLVTSVLALAALAFTILRQSHNQCASVVECLWQQVGNLSDGLDSLLFSFVSYDWLVQGLLLLFLLFTMLLLQGLQTFRAKVLDMYKQIILAFVLVLLLLFTVAFIVEEQYILLVLGYSLFSLTGYTALFLLRDVPRLEPKDSVVHRPDVLNAMIQDALNR